MKQTKTYKLNKPRKNTLSIVRLMNGHAGISSYIIALFSAARVQSKRAKFVVLTIFL